MAIENASQISEYNLLGLIDSDTTSSGITGLWNSSSAILGKHMLPLLTLASAEICWQLEVDMWMAALLEVGCLSPRYLVQSL